MTSPIRITLNQTGTYILHTDLKINIGDTFEAYYTGHREEVMITGIPVPCTLFRLRMSKEFVKKYNLTSDIVDYGTCSRYFSRFLHDKLVVESPCVFGIAPMTAINYSFFIPTLNGAKCVF